MKRQVDPLGFYKSTITDEFVEGLLAAETVVHRDGIFKAAIVMWLMISERLNPSTSLARAVKNLQLLPTESLLDRAGGSIRARCKRVSSSTGGYSQARERLSATLVEKVADKLCEAIEIQSPDSTVFGLRAYVLDGSTLRISHSKKNLAAYPATENQFGTTHFPIIRIGVAMNAKTGVAIRPAFGPYNGPEACGELELADQLLARLPKNSVVLGD